MCGADENMDVMVVGDVGELPLLYAVSEIAFVGGSLLEGQEGHNLAEAAVTGCAVLVGKHAGQFNRMAGSARTRIVKALSGSITLFLAHYTCLSDSHLAGYDL